MQRLAACGVFFLLLGGAVADRHGEYFHRELSVANGSGPVWQSVTVSSGGSSTNGNFLFPPASQSPTYDYDGNLTQDGLWTYTWDAENRLTKVESVSGVPTAAKRKLEFGYDFQRRRIWRKVYTYSGGWVLSSYTRFVCDGWNLIAELNASSGNAPLRSYLWGQDLSGSSPDGPMAAGGIGGLLVVRDHSGGAYHFVGYDGNGNVTVLVNASDQSLSAQYEYSPFGELIRATGPLAKTNPFRWSTKFWEEESGLVYYGFRYYSPSLGRWIGRDPGGEDAGENLDAFVLNHPIGSVDPLGLTTLVEEESATGIAGEVVSSAAQSMSIYWRIKNAVETFNTVQELGTMIMDADPENADEALMATLTLGADLLAGQLVKRVPVIGNTEPLKPFKQMPGNYDTFRGWTGGKGPGQHFGDLRRNVQWLRSIVERGEKEILIAPGSKSLRWNGSVSYYAMEAKWLMKHGYEKVGNKLIRRY